MIVRQPYKLERRKFSSSDEFIKLLQPDVGPHLVGDLHRETRIRGVRVRRESWLGRGVRWRLQSGWIVRLVDELAVVSVRDPGAVRQIPQISAGWLRHIILGHDATIESLVIVASAP